MGEAPDSSHFDIAIVGGGLAGGLAALAFAERGFSCALIDAQSPEHITNASYDGRTTAVAYAGVRMLQRLGLWSDLADNAGPIRDIMVTDGALGDPVQSARDGAKSGGVSSAFMHFDSRELGADEPLGWIIENVDFRRALYKKAAAHDGVTILAPTTVTSVRFDEHPASLTLRDQAGGDAPTIGASLVVAADGRHSSLRAAAKIKSFGWDYDQMGIVATLGHAKPHDGVAHELFYPSGPFAILPMAGDRVSIVWTEKKDRAASYLAMGDHDFLSEIGARVGDYLGDLTLAGPRSGFPLALTVAQRITAPRLALIGDAARAIHPIAGQGFNLGLKDIAALADVLEDARGTGLDIGALASLQPYERWRRFDSAFLALGTDALNHLFSNDIAPIRAARRFGLGAVQAAAPLRRFFMRQAGSAVGDLPTYLQPL